jgi:hypothetical protein
MPKDIAVQGFAQDIVTLAAGIPFLFVSLAWARRGARGGHLALAGAIAYIFVQYFLYLGMATYNELFLLWVALVAISFQLLVRMLLSMPPSGFAVEGLSPARRRYVGGSLIANAALIAVLWLSVIVPPLLDGRLYPEGLAHFTTMIVQGFDLALFLPPSLIAGWAYIKRRPVGNLLAPVYAVFLSLQMVALLAKILWMRAIGVSAGPALALIPMLLVGAVLAAILALQPHRGARL